MRYAAVVAALIFGSMVLAGACSAIVPGGLLKFATKADDLIDARMAATLAGLSLAAASFARDVRRRPGEADAEFARRADRNARSVNLLVRAFYVFTAVLAIGLSWDPASEPKVVATIVDLSGWAELIVSAVGLAAGLGMLVAGAHGFVTPERELDLESQSRAEA